MRLDSNDRRTSSASPCHAVETEDREKIRFETFFGKVQTKRRHQTMDGRGLDKADTDCKYQFERPYDEKKEDSTVG